jgi:hypothetical protein
VIEHSVRRAVPLLFVAFAASSVNVLFPSALFEHTMLVPSAHSFASDEKQK